MSLRKIDIAKYLSSEASLDEKKSLEFIDFFLKIIKDKSNTMQVKIPGFGTFVNKFTPERLGRNPKTGEEFKIKERIKLSLIASNQIKQKIN
jgi:integration host factor subunit alpha